MRRTLACEKLRRGLLTAFKNVPSMATNSAPKSPRLPQSKLNWQNTALNRVRCSRRNALIVQ
jgi:hypothetical protein